MSKAVFRPPFVQAFLTIWLLLWCYSCETVVDVNLPEHTPILVANSFFSPDSIWKVKLYKSRGTFKAGPFESVSNAAVEITDGENVIDLSHVDNGVYRAVTNVRPRWGNTYGLRASAPGFAPIESSDSIPIPVPIESVFADPFSTPSRLTIHFSDPPGEKNYYQIVVLEEQEDQTSGTFLSPAYFETNDLIFQEIGDVNPDEAIFDDALISDSRYSIKLRVFSNNRFPRLNVLLLSVSESYYRYVKSNQAQQQDQENPFSTPVQVYNNIANGLGIFAGYSASGARVFF
jgi:hypothetical protein